MTLAHWDDVEPQVRDVGEMRATFRALGAAAGASAVGVSRIDIEPGYRAGPVHQHGSEEEIFFVLDGDGTLLLGDEQHPVRAGSVVVRPPGTGVAHAFRAGDAPLTLLAFGTREPNDIVFFPRSGKVGLRGIRARFLVTQVEYWDGEA